MTSLRLKKPSNGSVHQKSTKIGETLIGLKRAKISFRMRKANRTPNPKFSIKTKIMTKINVNLNQMKK